MKDQNAEPLFANLDCEPWLTLSAWADQCAEAGDTDREKVIRWVIKWRRMPAQESRVYIHEDGNAVIVTSYYWYPKKWESESLADFETAWPEMVRGSKRSAHMIPYHSLMIPSYESTTTYLKQRMPKISRAYKLLVNALVRIAHRL